MRHPTGISELQKGELYDSIFFWPLASPLISARYAKTKAFLLRKDHARQAEAEARRIQRCETVAADAKLEEDTVQS
jgi:hypothetical protein